MRRVVQVGVVAVALALLVPSPPNLGAAPKGAAPRAKGKIRNAPTVTDNAGRMDANNLDLFVTNHGSFGWDLGTGEPGLRYPKGTLRTALFAAGIWVGAKVDGEIRTCVAEYSQEFAPGPMYDDPADTLPATFMVDQSYFKNFVLERGNTTSPDYVNWPSSPVAPLDPRGQGAPLDSLGQPLILGDKSIWSVYNDANPEDHTNGSAGRTDPLGLEIQQTTFAFARQGALGDIIFLKFLLINKGGNQMDSAYVSIWADPDLGDASDDLIGSDPALGLGYCYNADNDDAVYGSAPPAIGFDFFRGPTVTDSISGVTDTLGMTSLNKYINGEDPESAEQAYNLMKGLQREGQPVIDPTTNQVTTFQFPGNPVTNTGWLDSGPNDRRMQLSSGPFFMAPGDTQEVVCALIVGQGTDRLSSITALRQTDIAAQLVFDLNFDIPVPPPNPSVFVQPFDNMIRLVWGQEPVGFNSFKPALGQDFHFEGFRVWQLASNNPSAERRLLATYDVDDTVTVLYSDLFNNQAGGAERVIVASGDNSGLQFSLDIDTDAFRGSRLANNKPYYFAVTAYSFDVLNTEPFREGIVTEVLESALDVKTGIPRGSNAILTVEATQVAGDVVGHRVVVEQVDQNLISADSLYQVTFDADETWVVRYANSTDTLATGTNQSGDFDYPIVNGFMPRIISASKPASIFQILASGDSLDMSGGGVDSAGVYYLDNYVSPDLSLFNFADATNHDYEIRVLPDTTEFAWTYEFGDPSFQATFKVPFEIWDLGVCSLEDPSDDVKVTAMLRDDHADGMWSWEDRLYIRAIPYASVPWGTPGLQSTDVNPANDDQTLGRFGFVPVDEEAATSHPLPPPGRIRVRGGRMCPDDVFTFRLAPVGTAEGTVVKNDVNRILAVPNPYYAHSAYELTQFDRTLKFTNIPASRKVTVRIFNLAGDLVRTIRREATTADEMALAEIRWDLLTDRALPVGSGLYIYRVDVDGVGSKTDRMAIFIEQERLDNF